MESLIFSSVVLRGQGLASKFLVPTANLDPSVLVDTGLGHGVYFVRVRLEDNMYFAVLHFGRRSATDKEVSLELHILDFSGDVYGEIVEVETLVFLRPIKEFSGLQELKKQIEYDLIQAQKYVKEFS